MPWIRLEDNFDEHRKIIGLSDGAFRLWIRATAYGARQLTDGFIPRAAAKGMRPLDWSRCARQLIRSGLWETADGGYRIHDYHQYQPTREEVLETRRQRAEAGRKGGQRKGEAKDKQSA